MYSIDIDALQEASDEYSYAMAELEEVQEQTMHILSAITEETWSGADAEAFLEQYHRYLEEDYHNTLKQVESIKGSLGQSLDTARALKAYCEGFPWIFTGEMAGILPGNVDARGKLACDTEKCEYIKERCLRTAECADEILRLTDSIDAVLGGMEYFKLDVSGITNKIRNDCRRVKYLEDYAGALSTYVSNVGAWDESMKSMFCRIATADAAAIAGRYEGTSCGDALLHSKLKYLLSLGENAWTEDNQGELEACLAELEEKGDTDEILFFAQEIFSKKTALWSSTEAWYLAETYAYAYSAKKTDILEVYTNYLFYETYGDVKETALPHGEFQYRTEYIVKPDEERLKRLMANLNPETQGEAYYTLNRLGRITFSPIVVCGSTKNIENGSYEAKFQVTEGRLQLLLHAETQNQTEMGAKQEEQTIALTIFDMGEIITPEKERKLLTLGFTEKDVENLRLCVVTDTDAAFLDRLSSRDYVGAFDVKPDGISDYMSIGLNEYIMVLEYANEEQELENLINGILRTDPKRCISFNDHSGVYLEKIMAGFYGMIEANNEVAVLNYLCGADESLLEEQISIGDNLFKQYVLWTAVNELYHYSFGFDYLNEMEWDHCHGYTYIEISDLDDANGKDSDFYDFVFEIMDSETGQNVLGGYKGNVELHRLVGENYVAGEKVIKISQLKKELQILPIKLSVKGVAAILDHFFSGASKAIGGLIAWYEGDSADAADNALTFPYDKYLETENSTAASGALGDVGELLKFIKEYRDLQEKIEQEKQEIGKMTFSQAGLMKIVLNNEKGMRVKDSERFISENVVVTQMAIGLTKIEQKGIMAYLEEKYGPERAKELLSRLEDASFTGGEENYEQLQAAKEIILYGGEVSTIESDIFTQCLNIIDNNIEKNRREDEPYSDVRTWLRGREIKEEEGQNEE